MAANLGDGSGLDKIGYEVPLIGMPLICCIRVGVPSRKRWCSNSPHLPAHWPSSESWEVYREDRCESMLFNASQMIYESPLQIGPIKLVVKNTINQLL